jgi:predicted nucleic acid-binding protein
MTRDFAGSPPVVDASVGVKWYLAEPYSDLARRLVQGRGFSRHRLQVPDLFFAECANILWKRLRREELEREEVDRIAESLTALPFLIHPHAALMQPALAIAASTDRSAYDSFYLALAIRERTVLITADRRLWDSLAGTPLAGHLLWIEDVEDAL